MGFLEMFKLLMGLLPTIMDAVQVVEAAVPQAHAGAQKLATVLSTVQAAAKMAPAVVSSATEVKTAVQSGDAPNLEAGLTHVINAVVGLFNATGAFQKSGLVQSVTAANPSLAAPRPGDTNYAA